MPSTIVSRAAQSIAASSRSSQAVFLPRRCTMLSAKPNCRKSRRAIAPLQRRFRHRIRNLPVVQRSLNINSLAARQQGSSGALVHTDEYDVYARLEEWGCGHKTVCHARGEYARDDDGDGFCEVHVNTMEG